MLGHIAFLGFVALWNPGGGHRWSTRARFFLAGLAGGTAFLFDYSGLVMLLGLFAYGIATRLREPAARQTLQHAVWYVLGTLGPVGLLWFYQWKAFGHPFYPGQHWMPPVEWIELGYRGVGGPQPELLLKLIFDFRFGLFVSAPVLALALAAPFIERGGRRTLPVLELAALLGVFAGLWLLFGSVNYTRLQSNTGIRYLSPTFPFLFVLAAIVLMRLPRRLVWFIGVASVAQSWCLAMYRDVERGPFGVFEPMVQVLLGGFRLPALTTLSRLGGGVEAYFPFGPSPMPLFVLAAAILYGIWMAPRIRTRA
jgi:hypothetical protein